MITVCLFTIRILLSEQPWFGFVVRSVGEWGQTSGAQWLYRRFWITSPHCEWMFRTFFARFEFVAAPGDCFFIWQLWALYSTNVFSSVEVAWYVYCSPSCVFVGFVIKISRYYHIFGCKIIELIRTRTQRHAIATSYDIKWNFEKITVRDNWGDGERFDWNISGFRQNLQSSYYLQT